MSKNIFQNGNGGYIQDQQDRVGTQNARSYRLRRYQGRFSEDIGELTSLKGTYPPQHVRDLKSIGSSKISQSSPEESAKSSLQAQCFFCWTPLLPLPFFSPIIVLLAHSTPGSPPSFCLLNTHISSTSPKKNISQELARNIPQHYKQGTGGGDRGLRRAIKVSSLLHFLDQAPLMDSEWRVEKHCHIKSMPPYQSLWCLKAQLTFLYQILKIPSETKSCKQYTQECPVSLVLHKPTSQTIWTPYMIYTGGGYLQSEGCSQTQNWKPQSKSRGYQNVSNFVCKREIVL